MILALDTSGTELVVALTDGGKQVSGLVLAGPRHQDQVIEAIDTVAGDHLKALDAVAVAVGPGSHTGLRVGLSTASGLAILIVSATPCSSTSRQMIAPRSP